MTFMQSYRAMFRPWDSCRRVRSLRRNDTVTANLRVCGSAGENLKTEINSKRKKPWFQGFFSIYEDQIDGITYL